MSRTSKTVLTTLTTTLLALSSHMAIAKNVTLTEVGGQGLSVSGELLSYDGETYNVRTSLGDLQLDVLGSICAGDGCPSFVDETPSVSVAVNKSGRLPQIVNAN